MEDYKKKYEQALDNFKKIKAANKDNNELVDFIEYEYPELKESEDEKIRKALKEAVCYYWNDDTQAKLDCLAWLEKQGKPQVRKGNEWVNTIDNACTNRYVEEYAHGEYCDEQSFRWGFQEGVDWLEKQGEILESIKHKEAMLDCQTCANYKNECFPDRNIFKCSYPIKYPQDIAEKQDEQKPNFCHHEVDLSDCSEEYRKAYYDGWNNCNQQHAQLEAEQKPTDKVEPKFKVGDVMRTLQEVADGFTDGMPVVISIDEEYYHCTNELIDIKNQDNYEYPPINRRQKPTWSVVDDNLLNFSIENLTELKNNFGDGYGRVGDCIHWLKSLKERVKGE